MHKLLIADPSQAFSSAVRKQLKNDFLIKVCEDGERALSLVQSFEPDIFLVDLTLPGLDGLTVLESLYNVGSMPVVVVISPNFEDYVLARLEKLRVHYMFRKPCRLGAVVGGLLDVSRQLEMQTDTVEDPMEHINRILPALGFRMGSTRQCCMVTALRLRYQGLEGSITKCLYPAVGKYCGGNTGQVEKAIRDSIRYAWNNGSRELWNLYFPPGNAGPKCPSNDVFIDRIVAILYMREQMAAADKYKVKIV